jgi:hypothetical protein
MMYGNLSDSHLVKGSLWPQAVTQDDDTNGDGVDCLGYETLLAVVAAGDIAAGTVTVKLQESSDDGSTDAYADIASATTGAIAAAGDDEVYLIDVNLSERERYIRAVATDAGGGGANEVAAVFVLSKGRHLPPTQENTVVKIGYS